MASGPAVSSCDHHPHLGVVVGVRGLVLFDFGGTLDADGSRWSVRFHAAYRAVGGRQSFAAFDRAFRESDRALERLAGIERLGFRAMVDAQTALLLPRLSDGAALPARAIAGVRSCARVRLEDRATHEQLRKASARDRRFGRPRLPGPPSPAERCRAGSTESILKWGRRADSTAGRAWTARRSASPWPRPGPSWWCRAPCCWRRGLWSCCRDRSWSNRDRPWWSRASW